MHPFPYNRSVYTVSTFFHTWNRFVKFSAFTAVGFYDKVYVFGGARSNIEGETTVFMMGENLRWVEYRESFDIWLRFFAFFPKIQAYTSQSLLQRRKSFSSLIHRGNAIVHFGGEGTRTIEYWRPRSDGLFTILKSDYQLTGWSDTPMAFIVDKASGRKSNFTTKSRLFDLSVKNDYS